MQPGDRTLWLHPEDGIQKNMEIISQGTFTEHETLIAGTSYPTLTKEAAYSGLIAKRQHQ